MKKVNVIFAGIFFLLLSMSLNAQTKTGTDYFLGKWDVMVTGTPNGDAKMVVGFEMKDNKIAGFAQDSTGKELFKITSTEVTDKQATINFTTDSGYDVYLMLEKKDDNHTTGSMLGMFDATGVRIKENK